jgi:hypothetical protein
MREDLAYLPYTIMDMSDHRPEHCLDIHGRMDPIIDTPLHLSVVINRMIFESYTRLYVWHELDLRLAARGLSFRDPSANKQKMDAVLKFQYFARECLLTIAETLRHACLGMLTIHTRYVRISRYRYEPLL